jgi:hypothetical protein
MFICIVFLSVCITNVLCSLHFSLCINASRLTVAHLQLEDYNKDKDWSVRNEESKCSCSRSGSVVLVRDRQDEELHGCEGRVSLPLLEPSQRSHLVTAHLQCHS